MTRSESRSEYFISHGYKKKIVILSIIFFVCFFSEIVALFSLLREREIPTGITVYVTTYGECYHAGNCGYLRSKIPMKLESAAKRYRPCSVCAPQRYHKKTYKPNPIDYEWLIILAPSTAIGYLIGFLIIKKNFNFAYLEYQDEIERCDEKHGN